ncbi:hypothetical protein [Flammeovirga sp. SJP92]|uniref:hypothetical protein n=1 Tax=Flammeovirga sp. SJP92 TaxID=1775430 RepID=UPI0007898DCE|nr:hypothetical protein [Flammeovirga sp. SJP92]KXX68889.1 hypothetical protein AVL50_17160 [Flammeovirga sp. SJP92]
MKLSIILFFFIISTPLYAQSKIQKAKKSVKQKKERPYEKVSDNELNNKAGEAVFEILRRAATRQNSSLANTGRVVPSETTINTGYDSSSYRNPQLHDQIKPPLKLLKYPFADGYAGNTVRSFEYSAHTTFILEGNYYTESETIKGFNGMAQLNLGPKFSFNLRGNLLREEIDDTKEKMNMYHLNATYHLVNEEAVNIWLGIGLSTLSLDDAYTGHNYNVGTELFIAKPVSLYFTWHFGTFDEDIKFQEIHLDLKVYLRNFYLKAGYQNTKIVDVGFNGFALGAGVVIF